MTNKLERGERQGRAVALQADLGIALWREGTGIEGAQ